jgi:hypothetical protein
MAGLEVAGATLGIADTLEDAKAAWLCWSKS